MDYEQNQDERQLSLLSWLNHVCGMQPTIFTPLPADAGARRYFRAHFHEQSYVVMDASQVKESCPPFIAIGKALRQLGLNTPNVLAADMDRGYLLLTNFGETTYLKALTRMSSDHPNHVNTLYEQALTELAILHTCHQVPGLALPSFDANWMRQEWIWHQEWFLNNLLGLFLTNDQQTALDDCYEKIVALNTAQPQVFMHRDYHSANLMVLNDNKVGLLDFQDAFIGPVTYDLVSLLRDCYIAWPAEKINQWALQYWRQLHLSGTLVNVDAQTFLHWFDWMGIERHLKALFTFARKYLRDHDARYLAHMPRTLNYILQVSASYTELKVLHEYFQDNVQPALSKVISTCAR